MPRSHAVQCSMCRSHLSMSAGRNRLSDWLWQMIGRAVGGELDHPALVDLEGGAEDRLLVLGRGSRDAATEPSCSTIDCQIVGGVGALAGQQFLQIRIAHREGARQGLVGVDVGRDRLDAGRGAAADDADRGGRRDRDLVAEARHHAASRRRPGRRRALRASATDAASASRRILLEDPAGSRTSPCALSNGMFCACRKEWKPITPRPTERSRSAEYCARASCRRARSSMKLRQHIVEEAQHVLDEARLLVPLVPGLDVERGQAAHRGALLAAMVDAGRQRDLAAQVGGR